MLKPLLFKNRALVLLMTGMLLAACSSSTNNTPAPVATPAAAQATSPAPAATAVVSAVPASIDLSKVDYASSADYEGFHDITNCGAILGWVRNLKQPETPVKVDLYDGDALLTTVTADQPRADLAKAGKGSGNFGFMYPVPQQLKDGKPHTIRMTISGTQLHLTHTHMVLTCAP